MNNELYHYGVKGMKWGVRRTPQQLGKRDAKKEMYKRHVKAYSRKYDRASRYSDAADEKWSEVKDLYRKMGKNKIQRVIRAIRKDTKEAKAYSKAYDRASNMSDRADDLWAESDAAYKKTGRNKVSRVVNNIRYRK